MDVGACVATAIRNDGLFDLHAMRAETTDHLADTATPDWLAFALGWVAASAIVQAYFRSAGLDALPVYHPAHGWDRFLLTRRVSCALCADEPADSFGMLMLSGEGAPLLVHPNGDVRLALGSHYRADPEGAQAALREQIAPPPLPPGDHATCPHERAPAYPLLFAAITELIVAHPGVVAAREVYVDNEQIDGTYHPLYLHTGGRAIGHTYDWFAIAWEGRTIFVRTHGERVIYEPEPGTWRSEATGFTSADSPTIARTLGAWLQIDQSP